MEELLVVEAHVDQEEGDEEVFSHQQEQRELGVLLRVELVVVYSVVSDESREQNYYCCQYNEAGVVEELFVIVFRVELVISFQRGKTILRSYYFEFSFKVLVCN